MEALGPDGVSDNTTGVNQSCCPVVNEFHPGSEGSLVPKMGAGFAMVISATVLCAVISGSLNSVLVWALARVEQETLRAKPFIVNLSIANISVPVVMVIIQVAVVIMPFFHQLHANVLFCFQSFSMCMANLMFVVQPLCAIALACDRVYAVAKPLQYKLVGYSKRVKIALCALPWFMPLFIWIAFVLVGFGSSPTDKGRPLTPCTLMMNALLIMEEFIFMDMATIAANAICFFAYITILAIFRYQKITVSNIAIMLARSKQVSMTLIYFLSNVTTLALYLPAPLYSLMEGGAMRKGSSDETKTTELGLLTLYLCNTCLDPLILISRIRVIRNKLPIKKKAKSRFKPEIASRLTSSGSHCTGLTEANMSVNHTL